MARLAEALATLLVPHELREAALALGIAGLPPRRRIGMALLFAGFEAAMPLIGVALGVPLGSTPGGAADYLAAALVASVGLFILASREEPAEPPRFLSIADRGLAGAVVLGRFTARLPILSGPLAGSLHMPYDRVLLASASGGIVWASGLTDLLYYLCQAAEKWLARVSWIALIVARAFPLPSAERRVMNQVSPGDGRGDWARKTL